jgi:UDP-N-acetylglucosamine--N-acetylmuramyl-(pentapeptide) pyrophosphoryl-undecaprenol N-acetylglucosamine transferase
MSALQPKSYLIMAGGTGGHVFPALACARVLQAQGASVHWLGSRNGMEADIIGQAGLPMSLIAVQGLRGKSKATQILAPFRLAQAIWQALTVVRKVKPDCVLGMGGFASGPGGFAAWLLRRPLVIHEQNAVAGYTNRILARLATRVLEAFPGSFGPGVATTCTGNPVREDIARLETPDIRMAQREGARRLLVLGGSRGAAAINEAVPQALALLPVTLRPDVIHQAGKGQYEQTREAYAKAGVQADVRPFIDDMKTVYGWADLVVCRAGALTLAELCCAGIGSVLIPYPLAVDDHQTANARYLQKNEAAILLPQPELTPEHLAATLTALLTQPERLISMAQAARGLAQPDATAVVVQQCMMVQEGMEASHG